MAERSPWTKGVRAAWSYIEGAVERGITANAASRQARDLGFAFRRTDFLGAYREIAGIPRSRSVIDSTGLDDRLGRSAFQDTTKHMLATFEYRTVATIRNTFTGEVRSVHQTVATGLRLSKRQLQRETMGKITEGYPLAAGEEIMEVRTVAAFHREGDPWEELF